MNYFDLAKELAYAQAPGTTAESCPDVRVTEGCPSCGGVLLGVVGSAVRYCSSCGSVVAADGVPL